MFCGECGTQNPDTNQFCKNCGRPLRRPQQAAAAARSQPQPLPATGGPGTQPLPVAGPGTLQPSVKPPRNWLGIGSIFFGVLAWLLIPYILGILAVILGAISVYTTKKRTHTLAIAGIIGSSIAIIAMLVNYFYIFIF
jgi:hypothetical protein